VITTARTASSPCSSLRAAFSSRMSGSLMVLAGGRLRVTIAIPSSRVSSSVSLAIAGHSFEEDRGHRVGGVDQAVTPLAAHPVRGHLVHRAEEHLGGDLHGQVGVEMATGASLVEHGAD